MADQLSEQPVGGLISHVFPSIASGVLMALAGSPAVRVIRHSDLTTSNSGVILTQNLNLDGAGAITGLNQVDIAQSASASFYAPDDHFTAYFSAGTLDSVSLVGHSIITWPTTLAATNLHRAAETMQLGTVDDTAFAPTTTEWEAADITEAGADHWNGRVVIFITGSLAKQATRISDYSLVGGRGHLTCVALNAAPADGAVFLVL